MSTISVKSKSERGRWRIGRHFTRTATDIATSDITKEQLTALKGDAELIVGEVVETATQRKQRELTEAKALADRLNDEAAARELAALAASETSDAWAAAAKFAQKDSKLADKAWAALPAHDRVGRIEIELAKVNS